MAVDMFLTIKGVKGETQDKVFKDKGGMDILSWSWGVSNGGGGHYGGGSGAGKANFQDISLTKFMDGASSAIMGHCAEGEHFDEATLTVRRAGGKGGPVDYYKVVMSDVLVSSYSTGGSGGEDALTETVSLNFKKVETTYTTQTNTGGKGKPDVFAYDIAANTKA